jgi:hypothetical protein
LQNTPWLAGCPTIQVLLGGRIDVKTQSGAKKKEWHTFNHRRANPDNNEANLDTSQGEKEGNEQFLFPIIL